MSPSAANIMHELPVFVQTDHDIELTFGNAKDQIIHKVDTNGFLEFIKDDKLSSLCNPYYAMQCEYYNENWLFRKHSRYRQTLNIISLNIRSPRCGIICVLGSAWNKLPHNSTFRDRCSEHRYSWTPFTKSWPSLNTSSVQYFGGVGIYIQKYIFVAPFTNMV